MFRQKKSLKSLKSFWLKKIDQIQTAKVLYRKRPHCRLKRLSDVWYLALFDSSCHFCRVWLVWPTPNYVHTHCFLTERAAKPVIRGLWRALQCWIQTWSRVKDTPPHCQPESLTLRWQSCTWVWLLFSWSKAVIKWNQFGFFNAWAATSVTRLGYLATIFLRKVAQILPNFWGYFKKESP